MATLVKLLWQMFVGFLVSFVRLFWKATPKSVEGEIALVTGAGGGMGRLYCKRLAELGATVVAVDVNEEANAATMEILKQKGARAYGYTVDLRKSSEVHRLASKVRRDVGDVTMLINNAGVIYPTDILSLTEEMISDTFHVNVIAHFWLIKEFLPHMKERNHGHILSMASYVGLFGTAYMTDYSASKHAVVGLMEGLRNELKRQKTDGIKLTCVCPSFVTTGFVSNIRSNAPVPILTPEHVVDEAMAGLLRDKFLVTLPSATFARVFRDIVPDAVCDAVNAYIRPEVDWVDSHSTYDSNLL